MLKIGNRFSGTVYHGSGTKFDKFDQKKSRIANDFYGGGVAYFTADQRVGVQYAKSMAKVAKTDTPYLYTCRLNMSKVFDVDDVYTGKDLKDILPKDLDKFARGAGLMGIKVDAGMLFYKLQEGKMELTGDQVFKGLSQGMNQTATARQHLISKGYDGLRYNGGLNMGLVSKHDVYLAYNSNDISITKIERVMTPGKLLQKETV
jgi:hypothetical protein